MSLVLVVLVSGVAVARASGPAALDKPAFTATPAELLDVAKAAPAGAWPVVVLRHDEELSVDDRGRFARRVRAVYVVQAQAGVDDWGTVSWAWSPYYQDRPRVRARVVEPGGAIAELDPKLVTDVPEASTSPSVYSDRRRLAAPLPRLRIGAVVEYEVVAADHGVPLAAGTMGLVTIGGWGPTSSTRVVLSAPAARKARHFAHALPGGAKPVHEVARGRERWSYAFAALAPLPAPEAYVPGDGPEQPYLGLSTAASWNAVARAYRKLVDRRIADGPVAFPAGLPRAPTIETVRAITAWLHRQVRYTGIALGQASIVPWPPAETLLRGFGDCKDKATLLVALLRQAGLRAEVALLDTGPGRDVDPELPGIQGFDHAIVRVKVGGRDIWIDATEELAVPGRLPAADQGRRALIAADDTTALALTPAATAADSTIRQVRTFELSEHGGATRVTEVCREGGVFEPVQRRWLRDAGADVVKQGLTSYATTEYRAVFARHTTTPPEDLEVPFTTTVEATDARIAWTHRGHIEVALSPAETFEKVPSFLLHDDEPREPRRADFQWFAPHVFEIEHRLILPPGYTPPSLPADRSAPLGPATLAERYRLDGRTVVATFRFDSGKPRLSPAELARLRKELAATRARPVTLLIEHTGAALSEAGKSKAAVAEIERLIRLHPAEAVHHTELALVYMHAGMGAAARRAARRATELEPRNADAHAVLGWALRHDTFGREHGFDHDRAGALAAYARARKLDPKHVGAASEHGGLLLRSARGYLFADGAELPRAIEALRAAQAIEATEERGLLLANALFHSGALAEAERALRELEPSEARDGLLVAVIAAGPGGPAAAIQLAGSLRTGAARAALLRTAAQAVTYARRYDAMRALLAQAGGAAGGGPMPPFLQRLERAAAPPLGRDPAALAFELARVQLDRERASAAFWDAETADEVRRSSPASLSPALAVLPRAVLDDLLRATLGVTVTGDGAAWRLEVEAHGRKARLYAALDRGAAKIVAVDENLAGLGRHVLRLLARGDLASAARCLDWLSEVPQVKSWLAKLWGPGLPRDRDAIALAGAAVAGSTDADRVLAIATRCASKLPDVRMTCDHLIGGALRARRRWRELEAHAAAWSSRSTDAAPSLARIDALVELGRFDEADRAQAAASAALPSDSALARAWATIAVQRRDYAEAVRRYDALLQRPDAGPQDHNSAAWIRLFTDDDLPGALDLARKAAGPDRTRAQYPALNTLAAVEAELGDLRAAKLDAWQSMENIGRATPESPDWLIHGQIAEQLGLRDDAIASYRRVRKHSRYHHDSHALAQRRLARLGAKP